ncbi:hypothetical protein ACEWPM_015065 [Roseovarius sp. S4756]|uniref:hypothetical protein n=1 Tax=Roseovarius maritimus TaxID=3342637 RepID=UPI003B6857B2
MNAQDENLKSAVNCLKKFGAELETLVERTQGEETRDTIWLTHPLAELNTQVRTTLQMLQSAAFDRTQAAKAQSAKGYDDWNALRRAILTYRTLARHSTERH